MDIKTVAELACKTDAELLEYYNIGKKSVAEIRVALAEVSKHVHQLELDL
jgi:DNA-directed RNA polymerase alpha subunit